MVRRFLTSSGLILRTFAARAIAVYSVIKIRSGSQFDSQTLHSHNLYQIFTYVKNQDVGNTGNAAGMLLYAKTEEEINPNSEFHMSGNKIYVKTLDLNSSFKNITKQLNNFIEAYFDDVHQLFY